MAFVKTLFKTSLFVGTALGTLAIVNKVTEATAGELDTVLTGEERRYHWKYGDIFYKVQGARDAKPLVLIHITDELVEYIYTSTRQANSRFAIASLLSNSLNLGVQEPFSRLQIPVVAIWGREGTLIPSEASAAFKQANPNIAVHIIDKASLHVQDEQAGQFNNLIREFARTAVR